MDLYFLDHLCFFWTLGIINNHITEKSLYFENQPAIILNSGSIDLRIQSHQNKPLTFIINPNITSMGRSHDLMVSSISCLCEPFSKFPSRYVIVVAYLSLLYFQPLCTQLSVSLLISQSVDKDLVFYLIYVI